MVTNWFADDSFWETFYPVIFPDDRIAIAKEQVEKILALTNLKGGAVLDLACGPGRHAVAFAQKGFRVTGVDLSPFLLAKARQRANAAGVGVEWVQEDMRTFQRPGEFDLCLNLFTSFGYFEDREDDLKVLINLHRSLSDDGICILDMSGKEWLAKHFRSTDSWELDDGTLVIERREIVNDWGEVKNRWIQLKDGKAIEYQFQHRLYSAQELKARFSEAGFGSVKALGDLDGGEYGLEASRLIIVANK